MLKNWICFYLICLPLFIHYSTALEKNTDKSISPAEIRSNNFHLKRTDKGILTVFEGNVFIEDQDITISADRIHVYFDENNKAREITAFGRLHKPITATRGKLKAISEKANYSFKDNLIVMSGNPEIHYEDGSKLINAYEIVMDRRKDAKLALEAKGLPPKYNPRVVIPGAADKKSFINGNEKKKTEKKQE